MKDEQEVVSNGGIADDLDWPQLPQITTFWSDRLYSGSPYAIGPLSLLSCLSCLLCLSVTLVYCGLTV